MWPKITENVTKASAKFFEEIKVYISTLVAGKINAAEAETIATAAANKVAAEGAYAVATANVASKTGMPTVDGVVVPEGANVLLTDQTNAVENGLYEIPVGAGAWPRPPGFKNGELQPLGTFVVVSNGTEHANSVWTLKNKTAIVVGTTGQEWGTGASGGGSTTETEALLKTKGLISGSPGGVENTTLGLGAGVAFTGTRPAGAFCNTALGVNVMHTATTAQYNVGIGNGVLYAMTSAHNNVMIGQEAGKEITTGSSQTGIGTNALYHATTGEVNTAVGNTALEQMTTGSEATGLGAGAGYAATGSGIVAVGYEALGGTIYTAPAWASGTTYGLGEEAQAHGDVYSSAKATNKGNEPEAGKSSTWWNYLGVEDAPRVSATAAKTVAVGSQALSRLTSGYGNVAMGFRAMYGGNAAGGAPKENTAVGMEAMKNVETGANSNAAFGFQTLPALTTASGNAVFGTESAIKLTTGSNNTIIGCNAGEALTTQEGNVFIGHNAGNGLTASNELRIANNGTTPIIRGVMSSTAASNELGLGTAGGKIGFLAAASAPVVAKAAGAETTKAIWERLKELGLTL